jgi:tetratricopeptide (TPR) repeat protein
MEATRIETTETTGQSLAQQIAPSHISMKIASVRVSAGNYFSALLVSIVVGTLLFRFQFDKLAFLFFAFGLLLMPILAFTDKIVFDGKFIYRRGLLTLFERIIKGRNLKLSVNDVERVETIAVRTLIHNGRVHYRYRTEVSGEDLHFVFASGNGYRKMVRKFFSAIKSEKLDTRSCELRDYFVGQNELDANISLLNISSSDKLDDSTFTSRLRKRKDYHHSSAQEKDNEQGAILRHTANQLRASGRLRQAAEAFRRALVALPNDNWLLYEFARFLRSHANTLRDAKLLRRSGAALRLAAHRAKEDAALLSRIGESYFEFGDMERAAKTFHQAVDLDSSLFRAEMGLAEVGIRNGKLAHVIHHYASAARVAPDKALKRFAQNEIDYYSMLNSDEDYLDREIRRIDRLQFILFARRSCVRVTIVAFIFSLLSTAVDELLANVGWTFTATSLCLWFFLIVAGKFYMERNAVTSTE